VAKKKKSQNIKKTFFRERHNLFTPTQDFINQSRENLVANSWYARHKRRCKQRRGKIKKNNEKYNREVGSLIPAWLILGKRFSRKRVSPSREKETVGFCCGVLKPRGFEKVIVPALELFSRRRGLGFPGFWAQWN
jgi:hypothetical protein